MARRRFTILGSGSSGGVPRLGGRWGACDPTNPRNTRRRCSLLVEQMDGAGTTTVLIDTSPDMRQQLIDAQVGYLDAVIYTHGHADHVHGIDDLRQIVFNRKSRLPVWADLPTQQRLLEGFRYAFEQPQGSLYRPICDLHRIDGEITIFGDGGPIRFRPFLVNHGSIDALGFRVGDVAYLPDVLTIYEDSWPALENLDLWIVDALRRDPHPTHSHLAQTLGWIDRVGPRRAILTNMHYDLDYETVAAETPDHIVPAYDGLTIDVEV